MEIQAYSSEKLVEVADLFHRSVHAVDSEIYTSEEKEAWAPTPPDYARWCERLNAKTAFLAMIDDCVAGFIELDSDDHINCLYTHPNFQRRGVASALYEFVLAHARANNIQRQLVEASHPAKPFFEYHGFSVVRKNKIQRNGVVLVNFTMEKYLNLDD